MATRRHDGLTQGERMRKVRKARGFTLEEVAAAVGVSHASVSQWEKDVTKSLRPVNLFKAARFLKVNAEWLATGEGDELSPADLFEPLTELTAEDRAQIFEYIQMRVERAQKHKVSERLATYHAVLDKYIATERGTRS